MGEVSPPKSTLPNYNISEFNKGVLLCPVNCRGVMSVGVSKAIRNVYPEFFTSYYNFIRNCSKSNTLPLGKLFVLQIKDSCYVIGGFTKLNFGVNKSIRYTCTESLIKIIQEAHTFAKSKSLTLYVPNTIASDVYPNTLEAYEFIKSLAPGCIVFNYND